MTEPFDPAKLDPALKVERADLKRPVPMRIYHEQALCNCIDTLGMSLVQGRAALRQAQAAHLQVAGREGILTPAVIAWGESLAALSKTLDALENDGTDTIMAVRVLLNV